MSQLYIRPFSPEGDTVNLAVTAASQALAITRPGIGTQSVRILNNGSQTVFFKMGGSAVTTATNTGTPIFPGTVETFLIRNEVTHIAFIAAAVGSTVYVTTGESA